jgi:predicted DNA-binding transcriptional regulator YafY
MRRADRLFHIVQLIRGRRLTTAAWLAERMEVSERTIYRDVADLQLQGVPIEGEAGVGYRLGAGFDLPPMMFTQEEAKALVASVRMAQVWLDHALAQGAQDALGKILSVLPADARVAAEALAVYAPPGGLPEAAQRTLQTLREAVHERRKVFVHYRDLADKSSERTLRPLGCFYWGKVWTLAAWCEQRGDFRTFRVDRVTYVRRLDERFRDEPGRTLADLARLDAAKSQAASAASMSLASAAGVS